MIQILQTALDTDIPLTRSIGIKVVSYKNSCLKLHAPLAPNTNHKRTAFGGSLYSVSVLTGWGLIYLLMKEHGLSGHIVIQESQTRFLHPVTHDIESSCTLASDEQLQKFIRQYQRKGTARLKLECQINCDSRTSVIFSGSYVVHK